MKHDFIWDRTSMLSTCFRCGAVAQSREHAETALCVGFSPPPERIQVGRYVYHRSDLVILKDERVSALLDVVEKAREETYWEQQYDQECDSRSPEGIDHATNELHKAQEARRKSIAAHNGADNAD